MADDEKAARKYLQGLSGDKPWDTPLSSHPVSKPSPRPESKPAPKPRTTGDDAGDQVNRLMDRNKKIADRTRHLRSGSRSY